MQAAARTATLLGQQPSCELITEDKLSFKGEAFFMTKVPPGEVAKRKNLRSDNGRESHSSSFSRFKFHSFYKEVVQIRTGKSPRLGNYRI